MIKHNSGHGTQAAAGKVKIPVPVSINSKIIKGEKDLTGYRVGTLRTDAIADTVTDEVIKKYWDKYGKIAAVLIPGRQ